MMQRRTYLKTIGILTVGATGVASAKSADVSPFDASIDKQFTGTCKQTGEYQGYLEATAELPKTHDSDDITRVVWQFYGEDNEHLFDMSQSIDLLKEGKDAYYAVLTLDTDGETIDKIHDIVLGVELQS